MTDRKRHWKQELFAGLGPEGQAALAGSSVMVAGCGATGGTIALLLVRAGVGRVRVVDRDFPEMSNLGRQLLYEEADLATGLPKAVLAEKKLRLANSEVEVEGLVADIHPDNVMELIGGADLIMDGLDNQETRYLINDAAVSLGRPWVFTGAVGSAGNVTTVHPGQTPCLRCLFPNPAPPGSLPTCDTVGILGPAASASASIAAGWAIRILAGSEIAGNSKMIFFDLWTGSFREVRLSDRPDPSCPCCGTRNFEFLRRGRQSSTEKLCGIDAVQVNAPGKSRVNLKALSDRLKAVRIVTSNDYLLRFEAEGFRFAVFPDGRVVVQGTNEPERAKSLVERYVGY